MAAGLKQHFLEPVMTSNCSLSVDMENKKMVLTVQSSSAPPPAQVFQQVREVFSFVTIHLDVALEEINHLLEVDLSNSSRMFKGDH